MPFPGMRSFFGGKLGGTKLPVETNLPFGGRVGGLRLDSPGSSSMERRLKMCGSLLIKFQKRFYNVRSIL